MNKLSVSEDHNHHRMISGALNAIKRTYKATAERHSRSAADASRLQPT
jgi:hypothetical protein